MHISYIRGRAKQFRNTQNESERQALLCKMAVYLGLLPPGECQTPDLEKKVTADFIRLGINASYRRK